MSHSLFTILRAQHALMRKDFKRIEKEKNIKRRRSLFQALVFELVSHAHAEEQILYHSLQKRPDERPDALEMIEEHRLAEREIHAMATVDLRDDRWTAMIKVLRETTEHHFEEEEDKVFPEAEKLYTRTEKLLLGDQFLVRKQEIKCKLQKT